MQLYIDISDFLRLRMLTGIQRVIVEFLKRAIQDNYQTHVICFNPHTNSYQRLAHNELLAFFLDIENYHFIHKETINLLTHQEKETFFFDLDSVWNADTKRVLLYPKLKEHNFKIINFIYDLIPLKLPTLVRQNTQKNFPSFMQAVLNYSDRIFFDSRCTQNDFTPNSIPNSVVYLGSDFLKTQTFDETQSYYSHLLSQKYLLFVGTIEPRKQHALLLDAYEKLYEKYSELHLIFIGNLGWQVDEFIEKIEKHPLKNISFHHLLNINDETLHLFYKNAFIVTYLSKYEGYGLPIAESLSHGNITLVSQNSSIPEVGGHCSDYLLHHEAEEIIETVSLYYENELLYKSRKAYINTHYKVNTWDTFYTQTIDTLKKGDRK